MLFRKRPSYAENDFESIVVACRAGNASAQRALYKQFFGYAKSICLRYSATVEEAEEVLNEGFLKVFQHLDQYDLNQPFKAWLRTILVNTAISYYRKYHKTDPALALESVPEVPFADNVVERLTADEILGFVQQLPPLWRTVFNLHVVDGYSLREIADLLPANEATVRSHFLRARQRLQQVIKTNYPHFFLTDLRPHET